MNFIMRFSMAAIAAIVLALPSSPPAYSQGACMPDCFETPFGENQYAVLLLPGGCFVRVTYATRHACGIWWDLSIVEVVPLVGCDGKSVKQLLREATIQLLIRNPMRFPEPDPGECVFDWRVTNATCWQEVWDPCWGTLTIPCDVDFCCLDLYQICKDEAGAKTITKINAPTEGECADGACSFVCPD